MAKNRNSQSASIRFGPALTALFACFVIGGAAVGYVWQKGEIYRLGKQIHEKESLLAQLTADNEKLDRELADLRSPVMLDQEALKLNLGLAPAQPMQIVRLSEPSFAPPENKNSTHQFAQRPADLMTQ